MLDTTADNEDSEEEVRRKEEQRLAKDKEAVEEQAEIWSTMRYNERRKDDLRAWAENKRRQAKGRLRRRSKMDPGEQRR